MTTDAAIDKAGSLLAGAREVVAVGHVAPDGDSLGSSLALGIAARNAGKKAYVSFGEPHVLAEVFEFLPTEGILVKPAELPAAPEVMVAFDTAAPDRLGSLLPVAEKAGTLIVADHHATNDGFGDVTIVDPAVAASAELAHRLIVAAGWEVDADVALCLYVGLVTDSGRFMYSSTTPGTMRLAADLLERGVRPELVGQELYEKVPFGYLALAARVLDRAVLDEEHSLVWSVVLQEDLKETGLRYDDTDPLIDDLRVAREAGVALLLKELDGGFKGSLRSRGEADVGAVAAALGGGGHHNAAGFNHPGPADAVVAAVASRLDG